MRSSRAVAILATHKLSKLGMLEIPPLDPEATVLDGMPVPLWPITLARELGPYKTVIGVQPGTAACPDAQALVLVTTGRKSVRALVRAWSGESTYRKLDNLAKGNTTRLRLPKGTRQLEHGDYRAAAEFACEVFAEPADRSLVTRCMLVCEGFLYRVGVMALRHRIPCPCCGKNLLPDPEEWWGGQPVDIGVPEYALIDRVLLDLITFDWLISSGRIPLLHLAQPRVHPQANWLEGLKILLGKRHIHLKFLPVHAGAQDVDEHRVWAYARGDNMMPPEAIDDLLRKIDEPTKLRQGAATVRALSLAADLLQASCRGEALSAEQARQLVEARIKEMLRQLRLLAAHAQGKLKLMPALAPQEAGAS